MKTTAEKIAVMQAHEDGKKVQMLLAGGWSTIDGPVWNWEARDYRIKPEPREFRVGLDENGRVHSIEGDGSWAGILSTPAETFIKVREVIED